MITFDKILPEIAKLLQEHDTLVQSLDWLLVNRDLYGKVRLILPEAVRLRLLPGDEANQSIRASFEKFITEIADRLKPHVHSPSSLILFETSKQDACRNAIVYKIPYFDNVWLVDRLANETNWTAIAPESQNIPRIVFFSIKGGVGRSTSLAAAAWSLAQAGKRVLLLDLDLESPGLSTALLPSAKQPAYGIIDWLVEDLVENESEIFEDMVAFSDLSHDGEILIVPAHGEKPGEYISKLGRVWMPKLRSDGVREAWTSRLRRLLEKLEARFKPDIVLIDSRSGIDDIASACIADIGAKLILLFALEGDQTWSGYRMLFEQWQRADVAKDIRDRLKIVAAMIPEIERVSYVQGLRERAYDIFSSTLYDDIAPTSIDKVGMPTDGSGKWIVGEIVEGFNFDEADEGAPHYPLEVNWHRSFTGLRTLQGRLATIDADQVQQIFGSLVEGIKDVFGDEGLS